MVWAGWRRTTVGTSCKFCLMLATRGAVYTSEDIARYGYAGSKYHDHCDCGAELVTDPADANAIRVDPEDANRIIRMRVKGRDYVYDLSNYRNLGVADPPKAARVASVKRTPARIVEDMPEDALSHVDAAVRAAREYQSIDGLARYREKQMAGKRVAESLKSAQAKVPQTIGRGEFWRGTDNPVEPQLLASGKLRASVNHVTGEVEVGLSVSSHLGTVVGYGYEHVYIVKGRVVGYGSDGEPLLDVKRSGVVGKLMTRDQALELDEPRMRQMRKIIEAVAARSGLSLSMVDYILREYG